MARVHHINETTSYENRIKKEIQGTTEKYNGTQRNLMEYSGIISNTQVIQTTAADLFVIARALAYNIK